MLYIIQSINLFFVHNFLRTCNLTVRFSKFTSIKRYRRSLKGSPFPFKYYLIIRYPLVKQKQFYKLEVLKVKGLARKRMIRYMYGYRKDSVID